ncbi:SprT-like domain-containing protein, partial [Erythrobacter sp. SN021]|uniref:SprT-like domain-containing protein n=1 Tax=Erythrobacter sp. SN021 TaxID=2912574 RepID=UPI001F3BD6CB
RFANTSNPKEITDEIALNPAHFANRKPREVLSTIAHEMVHLWQHHYGSPPRKGYHDKQWAAKMHEIGLIPTDTGEIGGKETGQKVTHLIEENGR